MFSPNKLGKILAHPLKQQMFVISSIMLFRPLLMLTDKNVEFDKRVYAATREFFTELFGLMNVIIVGNTAEYLLTVKAHDSAFPEHKISPRLMAAAKKFDIKTLWEEMKVSKMFLGGIRDSEWETVESTNKSLEGWREKLNHIKKDAKATPVTLRRADAVLERLNGLTKGNVEMLSNVIDRVRSKNIIYSTLGVIVSCAILTPLTNNKVIDKRVLDFVSDKVDRARGVSPQKPETINLESISPNPYTFSALPTTSVPVATNPFVQSQGATSGMGMMMPVSPYANATRPMGMSI